MKDFQEGVNLSGLEYYGFRDYARMFSRRKWFVIITIFAVALLTAIIAYFVPNSYKATTVILVDPQKVPDYYVNSTVTISVVDRLATLRQQILSETRLTQVIDEMGLYKELRKKEPQEELVKQMQKDIIVELAPTGHGEKALGAFSVSYLNPSPVVASQVTNRLASLFIEENIKDREQSVEGTADFLTKELEDAHKALEEKEAQITALKTKNVGELPESETTQVQSLNTLQIELQGEREALNQAHQQKVYLESLLGDYPSVVNLDSDQPPEVVAMETKLAQEQGELDTLRKRYGPGYPDVVKKNAEIRDLQKQIADAEKENSSRAKVKPTPAKSHNPVVESQLSRLDDEIQQHTAKQHEIEQQIAVHQAQLERIPLFQQQISAVMRDYQAAQDHYKYLLERKFSADMASDLETRQKGERFEVLDAAQVPDKPDTPNRPLINGIGLLAGLIVAFVGTLALEILDPSIKTEREVISELQVPVFGEIPWLPTKAENRRKLRRTMAALASTAMLVTVYAFVVFITWR
jgi:polysaccharide chain length determinant protein (PEP-CTERM system associated)